MVSLHIGLAGLDATQGVREVGCPVFRLAAATRVLVLLFAICAFLVPENSPATVCLFRITDDEILVGADSFFETDGIEQAPKAVKIHQIGSLFYAIQGKTRIGETKLVDLVNRARWGAERKGEIPEFAQFFQQLLMRWLAETSKSRPDVYQPYALNGIVVTSLQIFGFRRGEPFMDTLEFVTENLGTSVAIRTQHMTFSGGKSVWIPAGCWTQGNPAKDFIITNDAVARMRFLFDREFRAEPLPGQAKVARPPVDILRVTASGARWVQRKAECPAITPYKISAGSVAASLVR